MHLEVVSQLHHVSDVQVCRDLTDFDIHLIGPSGVDELFDGGLISRNSCLFPVGIFDGVGPIPASGVYAGSGSGSSPPPSCQN